MELKYRFNEELNEYGKKKHLHQLFKDGEWKNLSGTSSVAGVLSKGGGLVWWASGLACGKFGWIKKSDSRKSTKEEIEKNQIERLGKAKETLGKFTGFTPEQYLSLLDEGYKAHSEKLDSSADEGVKLHEILERFVRAEMKRYRLEKKFDYPPNEEMEKIMPFVKWAKSEVKEFVWSEAHCFSSRLFTGGISDAGAILKDDSLAVIDFKSAKSAYPSHFLQDSGYATQIEENGLWDKLGKVNKKLDRKVSALIVVPFGKEVVMPEIRKNVDEYKQGFEAAVLLYRLLGLEKLN